MYFPNGKNSRSQRKGCKTEFLPDDSVVNNLPANAGDSFYPWVRKIPWRKKWRSTPVFLPGKYYGQRSLVGCSPRGCKGSDTTEWLTLALFHFTTQRAQMLWNMGKFISVFLGLVKWECIHIIMGKLSCDCLCFLTLWLERNSEEMMRKPW